MALGYNQISHIWYIKINRFVLRIVASQMRPKQYSKILKLHSNVTNTKWQSISFINNATANKKLTCSLWLSPSISGCWFTPKKKMHSRQLAIQIRFAATITWTRSQCSTLTACQVKKGGDQLPSSYANAHGKHKISKMFQLPSLSKHRQSHMHLIQVNNFIASFKIQIQLKVLHWKVYAMLENQTNVHT